MPYATGFELPALKTKGALGAFYERLQFGQENRIWPKHAMRVSSVTETENYAFAGALPKPQLLEGDRRYQGMMDFSYSLSDDEYELSFLVRRKSMDDDQTGTIRRRFVEIADACNHFEDDLFATLLTNGNVSGSNAYDGVIFHGDSRTIGSSGTIDNNTTSAAATGTIPTAQEFLAAIEAIRGTMWRYADDAGRVGMIRQPMSQLRVVIPPTYERAAMEAFNSTIMPQGTTATNTQLDNVYGLSLGQFDVLPQLTSDAEMFVNAVGGETKPFVAQERMSDWEIIIIDDPQSVAENHGVKVLCYKRLAFGYGEPRMSVLHTFS